MNAPHYWIWKVEIRFGEVTYVMSRHGDLLDAAADIRKGISHPAGLVPGDCDVIRAERVARGPLIDPVADANYRAEMDRLEWGTTQSMER